MSDLLDLLHDKYDDETIKRLAPIVEKDLSDTEIFILGALRERARLNRTIFFQSFCMEAAKETRKGTRIYLDIMKFLPEALYNLMSKGKILLENYTDRSQLIIKEKTSDERFFLVIEDIY